MQQKSKFAGRKAHNNQAPVPLSSPTATQLSATGSLVACIEPLPSESLVARAIEKRKSLNPYREYRNAIHRR